jgi:hypothetical protein
MITNRRRSQLEASRPAVSSLGAPDSSQMAKSRNALALFSAPFRSFERGKAKLCRYRPAGKSLRTNYGNLR